MYSRLLKDLDPISENYNNSKKLEDITTEVFRKNNANVKSFAITSGEVDEDGEWSEEGDEESEEEVKTAPTAASGEIIDMKKTRKHQFQGEVVNGGNTADEE